MTDHDVLSAFLDNEPFEADALQAALSDAEGRALLVDLIALRHVAQPDETPVVLTPLTRPRRIVLWVAAAAASIAIAAASGYRVGVRRDALSGKPPEPTVVVKAQWNMPTGGAR